MGTREGQSSVTVCPALFAISYPSPTDPVEGYDRPPVARIPAGQHRVLKCFYNIRSLIAHGENAPAALGLQRHTRVLEKLHDVGGGKPVHRAVQKFRIADNVFQYLLWRAVVRDVASALAGYSQLFSRQSVSFVYNGIRAAAEHRSGCHKARGTAAHNGDAVFAVHSVPPLALLSLSVFLVVYVVFVPD